MLTAWTVWISVPMSQGAPVPAANEGILDTNALYSVAIDIDLAEKPRDALVTAAQLGLSSPMPFWRVEVFDA